MLLSRQLNSRVFLRDKLEKFPLVGTDPDWPGPNLDHFNWGPDLRGTDPDPSRRAPGIELDLVRTRPDPDMSRQARPDLDMSRRAPGMDPDPDWT